MYRATTVLYKIMKRGRSISDWMTSALSKGSTSSHLHPPPTQKKRLAKKPSKPEPVSHKHEATPLTAGTLLADSEVPWSVKYQPKTAVDLAVNKKKVSEVQQWMEFALSPRSRHPMLLLTGPPGCGKTATLHALSRDMAFSVVEWVNPNTDALLPRDAESRPGDLVFYPESQPKQFRQFLARANRYPSLQVGGAGEEEKERKVVLVEEFPNAFIRDPSKFHEVIRSVSPTLHYPLVFIVSESHRGEYSSSSLFSRATLSTMDIHTISFNPIAHTSMVKTLQKVAFSECQKTGTAKKSLRDQKKVKFHMPPKEVIEGLAESSAGDIRSAINALQFACLTDPSDLLSAAGESQNRGRRGRSTSSASCRGAKLKRHVSSEVDLCGIGGRDSSLFLFRALGKILYCKRDTSAETDGVVDTSPSSSVPPHLKCHDRPPLLVNPESVVEHTHMSPDMFILYLHQNYIDFYENVDDVSAGATYLSDADILGRMWTDSSDKQAFLSGYGTSVASRGLMHSNNPLHHSTSAGKWRPLHKPQWTAVSKQYRENCQAARGLFLHLGASPHSHLWTPIELQTEILPCLALSNVPLRNPGQVSLLQSVTYFGTGYHRLRPEALGEKDVDDHLEAEFTPETGSRNGSTIEQECSSVPVGPGHSKSLKASPNEHRSSSPSSSTQDYSSQSYSQDVHMGTDDTDCEIEDFDDELLRW